MIQATTIDVSGLGRLMASLQSALIGTTGRGDLTEIVSDETRKLALEIGKAPSSSQRKRLEKGIRRDIGRVFLEKPYSIFERQSQRHGSGIEWLTAGPGFLLGARPEQMLTRNSLGFGDTENLKNVLYEFRNQFPNAKYEDLGPIKKAGVQHAMRANRFIIAKAAMNKLFNDVKKRIGKRDASFAETAQKLGAKNIPEPTRQHFPTKHNITQLGGLKHPENPTVTFGSNAKGVKGLAKKVTIAVKVRQNKIKYRIGLVLKGYANGANTIGVIATQAKKTNES